MPTAPGGRGANCAHCGSASGRSRPAAANGGICTVCLSEADETPGPRCQRSGPSPARPREPVSPRPSQPLPPYGPRHRAACALARWQLHAVWRPAWPDRDPGPSSPAARSAARRARSCRRCLSARSRCNSAHRPRLLATPPPNRSPRTPGLAVIPRPGAPEHAVTKGIKPVKPSPTPALDAQEAGQPDQDVQHQPGSRNKIGSRDATAGLTVTRLANNTGVVTFAVTTCSRDVTLVAGSVQLSKDGGLGPRGLRSLRPPAIVP